MWPKVDREPLRTLPPFLDRAGSAVAPMAVPLQRLLKWSLQAVSDTVSDRRLTIRPPLRLSPEGEAQAGLLRLLLEAGDHSLVVSSGPLPDPTRTP